MSEPDHFFWATRFLFLDFPYFFVSVPLKHSLHWLRITERIEYKLLSLIYKVFTTTQPPYLYNLIFVQRPHSTRSSSIVTLAQPPKSSSLKNNWSLFLLCFTLSFGISSLYLFVNLILVPVPRFQTDVYLYPLLHPQLVGTLRLWLALMHLLANEDTADFNLA